MSTAAIDKIRVVIPFHKGNEYIDRCLSNIENSTASIAEVIIVDNSPERLAQDRLDLKNNIRITVLQTKTSIGFGRACNIGIDYALSLDTSVVILLNQDTCLLPDAIGLLSEVLFDSAEIFASFPISLDYEVSDLHDRYIALYVKRYSEYIKDLILRKPKKSYAIGPTDANGSCVALKADLLRNVTHFDPLYWMYGEENDMFSRASAKGYRFMLVPAARVGHRHANFSDRSADPAKFRTLHRFASQLKILKDPSLHPSRACLKLLSFSINSYSRGYSQLGFPFLKCAIASDIQLVKKIRQALLHRSPEEIQKSIQNQMLIDKNIYPPEDKMRL